MSGNYDQFRFGSTPPALATLPEFQGHMLGAGDVVALSGLYEASAVVTSGRVYLALGADQDAYAEVLGFMLLGAIAGLERALSGSLRWRVTYRNGDAVIYETSCAGSSRRVVGQTAVPLRWRETAAGVRRRSVTAWTATPRRPNERITPRPPWWGG